MCLGNDDHLGDTLGFSIIFLSAGPWGSAGSRDCLVLAKLADSWSGNIFQTLLDGLRRHLRWLRGKPCCIGLLQGARSLNQRRQGWGQHRVFPQTPSPRVCSLQLPPPMFSLHEDSEVLGGSLRGSPCWCRASEARWSHTVSTWPQCPPQPRNHRGLLCRLSTGARRGEAQCLPLFLPFHAW